MAFEIPYHISHIETQYDTNIFNKLDISENNTWETLYSFPKEIKVWCEDTDNKKYLLYHCECLNVKGPGNKKYVLYEEKSFDPSNQKERISKIFVKDINEWFNIILSSFKNGQLVSQWARYYISTFKRINLSYRQVKAILTFEHNSSRFIENKPEAVITKDPKDITSPLQLDKYIIDSHWMHVSDKSDRNVYSCVTNDESILKWLNSIKQKY